VLKRKPWRPGARRLRRRRPPVGIPALEWRNAPYRRFLAQTGMCIAAVAMSDWNYCAGPIDPCHTRNNGMGSKGPDASCAPLCRSHHAEYDAGRSRFEAKYRVDMAAEAERWWKRFNEQ